MTNREWLNSLTNEELAHRLIDNDFICETCAALADEERASHICHANDDECAEYVCKWLDSERKEEIHAGDVYLSSVNHHLYMVLRNAYGGTFYYAVNSDGTTMVVLADDILKDRKAHMNTDDFIKMLYRNMDIDGEFNHESED